MRHQRDTTRSRPSRSLLQTLLVPFTASVAVSRVVLGLHYPSDVLAATGIGSALGALSLWLVPGVSLFG